MRRDATGLPANSVAITFTHIYRLSHFFDGLTSVSNHQAIIGTSLLVKLRGMERRCLKFSLED